MSEAAKETKAQRVERLKRRAEPVGGLRGDRALRARGLRVDPPGVARTPTSAGGASIPRATASARWAARAARARRCRYFMLRIRIPNGFLSAAPAPRHRRPHRASRPRRGRPHRPPEHPAPLGADRGSARVVSTRSRACGLDHARHLRRRHPQHHRLPAGRARRRRDRGRLAAGARGDRDAQRQPEFYNLPRKFKVSITGCRVWCIYPGDQRRGAHRGPPPATPARRASRCGWAAGSPPSRISPRASTPSCAGTRCSRWSRAWPRSSATATCSAQNREKARLKFLFLRPWLDGGAVPAELERRLGFRLDPAVPETPPDDVYRDHVGIHPQKQAGPRLCGPRRSCAGGSTPDTDARRRRTSPSASAPASSAPPPCRTSSILNVPRRAGGRRSSARARRAGLRRWTPRRSGAAPWPARARVLQARAHRDQGLRALAGGGPGGAPARLRAARADQRHRLPEQLRPALDRRHRASRARR